MKAFFANAEWSPRPGWPLTQDEEKRKRAITGSRVWKNPVFSMQNTPVPEPAAHEVLIRVKRCGICGSDTHLHETDSEGYIIFSGPVKLPCIIGHEYAGVVEQVGKEVRDFAPGDPVAAESIVWCGRCAPCRSGVPNQCRHAELAGITVDGALAEYAAVNELQVWKIDELASRHDDDLLFDVGSLIEPVGCAYNGMFISAGGFLPGAVVAVHGAGPIGLGAAALAASAGASKILVFDPMPERLAIAAKMGASHVYGINALAAAGLRPRDIVLEQTSGRGADVHVEAAGAARQTLPEMEASLAVNGVIVYLGRTGLAVPLTLDTLVTGANRIVGARGHSGRGIYPNIIRLLASGRLNVEEMITARLPFAETMAGIRQSSSRKDGKILINMDEMS
jgi:hypothetical protein